MDRPTPRARRRQSPWAIVRLGPLGGAIVRGPPLLLPGGGGHLEPGDDTLQDGSADDLPELLVGVAPFRLGALHDVLHGRHELGGELFRDGVLVVLGRRCRCIGGSGSVGHRGRERFKEARDGGEVLREVFYRLQRVSSMPAQTPQARTHRYSVRVPMVDNGATIHKEARGLDVFDCVQRSVAIAISDIHITA